MKWVTNKTSDRYEFYIEKETWKDVRTGLPHYFYTFYAFDNKGDDHRDYQQDDLEMAQRSAFRHFAIPLNSWKQVE